MIRGQPECPGVHSAPVQVVLATLQVSSIKEHLLQLYLPFLVSPEELKTIQDT